MYSINNVRLTVFQSGVVVEPVSSEEAMKSAFVKERNEVMDQISKQSREDDRPKSLLELHHKKLKKKKKVSND